MASKTLSRFAFFPIRNQEAYEAYKTQVSMFWLSEELDYSRDKEDYANLPDNERHMLDMINAFFAPSDGIVSRSIVEKLSADTNDQAELAYYAAQNYIECVHAETYNLIIETLVQDTERKKEMLHWIDNNIPMHQKGEWVEKFMAPQTPRNESLLAMACTEGIFFTSSFLFIFYFRTKKVLQNIITANEFISKDEALHRDTGLIFYRQQGQLPEERAHEIVRQATELELAFAREVLKIPVEGLNIEQVSQYVRYLADDLLKKAGHSPIFQADVSMIPTWMSDLAMEQKSNFYELRVTNYKNISLRESLDLPGRISGRYQQERQEAYVDPLSIEF